MNLKILGGLLGVFLILVSVWSFDWNNWNKIIVSILLFLSGLITLSTNMQSEFLQKTRSFLLYICGIAAIFLVFKLLILG